MKNIKRHLGTVSNIERVDTSYFGNPRYSFMIDGYTVYTAVNSSYGYCKTKYANRKITITAGTHYNRLTLNSIEKDHDYTNNS